MLRQAEESSAYPYLLVAISYSEAAHASVIAVIACGRQGGMQE